MPATFDWRRLGDRALRLLFSTVFTVAGGMKLVAAEFEVSNFERFGYANWFMYAVGIAQLLGAASLWVRRYVAYGALFLATMMAGGAVSHLRAGDGRHGGSGTRVAGASVRLGLHSARRAFHRLTPDQGTHDDRGARRRLGRGRTKTSPAEP